jgi:hypothetical protein
MSETAERIEERLCAGECVCTDGLPVPEYMLIEKAEHPKRPDGVIVKVFESIFKAVLDSGKLVKD